MAMQVHKVFQILCHTYSMTRRPITLCQLQRTFHQEPTSHHVNRIIRACTLLSQKRNTFHSCRSLTSCSSLNIKLSLPTLIHKDESNSEFSEENTKKTPKTVFRIVPSSCDEESRVAIISCILLVCQTCKEFRAEIKVKAQNLLFFRKFVC